MTISERSRTPVRVDSRGTIINTKDWNWHSDINFSTVKNTVKELYGGTDIIDNYTIIREGDLTNHFTVMIITV